MPKEVLCLRGKENPSSRAFEGHPESRENERKIWCVEKNLACFIVELLKVQGE